MANTLAVPRKPAIQLKPGEFLMDCGGARILMVAYVAAKDLVTVKTAEKEHQYRLDERVSVLPRDE